MTKDDYEKVIHYADNALSELTAKDEDGALDEIERMKEILNDAPKSILDGFNGMCEGIRQYTDWDVKYRSVEDFKFRILRHVKAK